MLFKASGFGGVDLEMPSSQDPTLHTQSLLLARAVDDSPGSIEVKYKQAAIIVQQQANDLCDELVLKLRTSLEGILPLSEIVVMHFDELKGADLSQTLCISLAEIERPALAALTADEFLGLREMFTVSKGLLWVTGDPVKTPEYGMATGLIRTSRWERDLDDVNLVKLSLLNDSGVNVQRLVDSISQLCSLQFTRPLDAQEQNGELTFDFTSGRYSTARLKTSFNANEYLLSKLSAPKRKMMRWQDAGRPIKLSSASPGILSKLEWVTDLVYYTPLDPTHVEIKIEAMGLNFRDLMIAMGEHMAYSIGCEASGKSCHSLWRCFAC